MELCQSTGKTRILLVVFSNLLRFFFACRIVVLALLWWDIKARHEIPEFLNSNLWLVHLHRLELKASGYFHFAQFLLIANCYRWLVSDTVDGCLQNIFKSKIEACPVKAAGCQTSHFICNLYGCKLWLLLIQNHSRHGFQAFAQCAPPS